METAPPVRSWARRVARGRRPGPSGVRGVAPWDHSANRWIRASLTSGRSSGRARIYPESQVHSGLVASPQPARSRSHSVAGQAVKARGLVHSRHPSPHGRSRSTGRLVRAHIHLAPEPPGSRRHAARLPSHSTARATRDAGYHPDSRCARRARPDSWRARSRPSQFSRGRVPRRHLCAYAPRECDRLCSPRSCGESVQESDLPRH